MSIKKLKIKKRNKSQLIRANKKKTIIIIILVLLLVYFMLKVSITRYSYASSELEMNLNEGESESDFENHIQEFVYGFLQLEYPFFTKFLIFLGIIYLCQVALSIGGDLIQLVLILGVVIYRTSEWIYKK